mgnify:CR=1 FL=1
MVQLRACCEVHSCWSSATCSCFRSCLLCRTVLPPVRSIAHRVLTQVTPNFTTELDSVPENIAAEWSPLYSDTSSPVEAGVPSPPPVAVRVVTASGEYRMGDHDTRADAVRLAIEAAKRQALEQVATYLESVTEVKNLDVTRDDIRTYTAGIVMRVGSAGQHTT